MQFAIYIWHIMRHYAIGKQRVKPIGERESRIARLKVGNSMYTFSISAIKSCKVLKDTLLGKSLGYFSAGSTYNEKEGIFVLRKGLRAAVFFSKSLYMPLPS